jgi:hypothetical protein
VFLHELMFLIEQFMKQKAGNESIKLWAAKEDCWKVIKEQPFLDLEFITMDLMRVEKVKKRIAKTEAYWQEMGKAAQIQLVQQVSSQDWDAIESWAHMIKWTEYQINTIITINHAKILGKKLTDGQLKRGLEILNSYSKHQMDIAEVDPIDLDYLKMTHETLMQLLKWNSRRQELTWKENMTLMDFIGEHLEWSKEDRQHIWAIIKRFKGVAFKI